MAFVYLPTQSAWQDDMAGLAQTQMAATNFLGMQWYGLGNPTIRINKSPGTCLEMLDVDSGPYRPGKLIVSRKCGVDNCCTTSLFTNIQR